MEEQIMPLDQNADILGDGFFLRMDLFDQVIKSLSATYAQLSRLEIQKDDASNRLAEKYNRRQSEILTLKNDFVLLGSKKRTRAAEIYFSELNQVRSLLDQRQEFQMLK